MSWDDDDFEVEPVPAAGQPVLAPDAPLKVDDAPAKKTEETEAPAHITVPKFDDDGFESDPEPEPVAQSGNTQDGPSRFSKVSKNKAKGRQKKAAELQKNIQQQIDQPAIKLTPAQKAEQEARVRAEDFKNTESLFSGVKSDDIEQVGNQTRDAESESLFGSGPSDNAASNKAASKLDQMRPETADDFEKFARLLAEKITPYQNSYHYTNFLVTLIKESSGDCSAEDLKEVVSGLNVIINSKIKVNVGKKTKQKTAAKKKAAGAQKKEVLEEDMVSGDYDEDSFI
eukprot:TRINITY_DN5882_c0_g1_i1.p1 TRINITY_DN5882_c0_g1~~TRINITY_DN5882_c0_g1_i1.p1  ORF type:complete len:285 (+),score=107.11 TRINITY_DN5882_c0_g1_i1:89-943(+)